MAERCGAEHPEDPRLLCDKERPCWGYHMCGDEVWDGVPIPDRSTKESSSSRVRAAAAKASPAASTGPPEAVRRTVVLQGQETPYAGSSGWSGSDTSYERAREADSTGATGRNQAEALRLLDRAGREGLTYQELGALTSWHHGQSSGVLSVLHKTGHIARLTEKRDRCKVYVAPRWVDDRPTEPQGRRAAPETI